MGGAHLVAVKLVANHPSASIDAIGARIVELGATRVRGDMIGAGSELGGMPDIVLVGERDEVVLLDRGIVDKSHDRTRQTLLRAVVDDLDVVVLGGVGLENPERVVGRAVIGDAQGYLDALLAEYAIELFREVFLAVMGGHENQNARDAGHDSPFAAAWPCSRTGGGTGIRTLEAAQHRLTVFKTVAFNHSAIPPHVACIAVFYARK